MSNPFHVKVNNEHEFSLSKDDATKADVITIQEKQFHILKNNTSYTATVIDANVDAKTYTVSINNNTYTVAIADALDQLIKNMGFEVGASKHVNDIKAPMPGLILDIVVTEGQEVAENDPLLILEAMKMENSLVSPRAGVIKSISVAKGDAVDKNQLLIEFE
jgi:biotin carboxyl carrier protein